jgi:hypothetical protein
MNYINDITVLYDDDITEHATDVEAHEQVARMAQLCTHKPPLGTKPAPLPVRFPTVPLPHLD